MTRVNPTVYNSIASLSNEPDTTVVVFSGSDKAKLDETFGDLNVWLAAENGIFMRPPPDEEGDKEVRPLSMLSAVLIFRFSTRVSYDRVAPMSVVCCVLDSTWSVLGCP